MTTGCRTSEKSYGKHGCTHLRGWPEDSVHPAVMLTPSRPRLLRFIWNHCVRPPITLLSRSTWPRATGRRPVASSSDAGSCSGKSSASNRPIRYASCWRKGSARQALPLPCTCCQATVRRLRSRRRCGLPRRVTRIIMPNHPGWIRGKRSIGSATHPENGRRTLEDLRRWAGRRPVLALSVDRVRLEAHTVAVVGAVRNLQACCFICMISWLCPRLPHW